MPETISLIFLTNTSLIKEKHIRDASTAIYGTFYESLNIPISMCPPFERPLDLLGGYRLNWEPWQLAPLGALAFGSKM